MLPLLLSSSFFHTTEFYVLLFVAAALLVGFIAMPAGAGPAREFLLASVLYSEEEAPRREPAIEAECRADGSVVLRRTGLDGIPIDGAVSAKITVKGLNITVEERIHTPRRVARVSTSNSNRTTSVGISNSNHIQENTSISSPISSKTNTNISSPISSKIETYISSKNPTENHCKTSTENNSKTSTENHSLEASEAVFILDFLAHERYYLRYESEATSTHATLTFRNTPGYHAGPSPLRK